jgi:hypothetical protein
MGGVECVVNDLLSRSWSVEIDAAVESRES